MGANTDTDTRASNPLFFSQFIISKARAVPCHAMPPLPSGKLFSLFYFVYRLQGDDNTDVEYVISYTSKKRKKKKKKGREISSLSQKGEENMPASAQLCPVLYIGRGKMLNAASSCLCSTFD